MLMDHSHNPKTLSWHKKKQAAFDLKKATNYNTPKHNKGYFIIHPDFVSEKDNKKLLRKKQKMDQKYWGVTHVKPTYSRGPLLPYIGGTRKNDYK